METLHFALQQLKIRKLLTAYYLAWRLTMTFQIIHHSVHDKLPRGGGPLLVLVHLL